MKAAQRKNNEKAKYNQDELADCKQDRKGGNAYVFEKDNFCRPI
jgi:hypothetical protein